MHGEEMLMKIREELEERHYDDGLYSLHIGIHSDMSGPHMNLCRYMGNAEVLEVIVKTIGLQLESALEEFEKI